MATSPEIRKAIELIDAKIAQLLAAKATLLDAFGNPSPVENPEVRQLQNAGKGKPDRFSQLVRFLTAHGPMLRKDILMRSGIPEGTIAYLLSTYTNFVQQPDGRWAIGSKESQGGNSHQGESKNQVEATLST